MIGVFWDGYRIFKPVIKKTQQDGMNIRFEKQ